MRTQWRTISIISMSLLMSAGCAFHSNIDEDANDSSFDRPSFGSICRYSSDGEFGSCPASNQEIVGMPCSCASPLGQQSGTISRR
ncbi:hypothetical protein [Alteromonas sp. A079]|uniref:hypothetical protein n=1 Tax=Alteromonas sp. A079 TaxID=3410268 RepID=UPI003BA1A1B0